MTRNEALALARQIADERQHVWEDEGITIHEADLDEDQPSVHVFRGGECLLTAQAVMDDNGEQWIVIEDSHTVGQQVVWLNAQTTFTR